MMETSFDPETGARLNHLLEQEYDAQDRSNPLISPIQMADAVYARCLLPSSSVPKEIYYAAILELRQLARQVCARKEVTDEDEAEAQGLLPFAFQRRYPRKRSGDSQYVLFENMSYEDLTENIVRLRTEAKAKHRHADALEAHRNALVASGKLKLPIGAAENFPAQ